MKEAEVILARSAGFCFGVHRAVDTVYEEQEWKMYTHRGTYHTFKMKL